MSLHDPASRASVLPHPFGYCVSGGDPALLLSDELPEDDPVTGVADWLRETGRAGQPPAERTIFLRPTVMPHWDHVWAVGPVRGWASRSHSRRGRLGQNCCRRRQGQRHPHGVQPVRSGTEQAHRDMEVTIRRSVYDRPGRSFAARRGRRESLLLPAQPRQGPEPARSSA